MCGVFVVYGVCKGGIKVVRNICYQPCINRVFTVFSPTDAADEWGEAFGACSLVSFSVSGYSA